MLTTANIISKSSVERVKSLSTEQLQAILDSLYPAVQGLGLNSTALNYDRVLDLAVFAAFEWYVSNPSMLKSFQQGRWIETYALTLPPIVMMIVKPILAAPFATMTREER